VNAPDPFVLAEMGPTSRGFADYAVEVKDDANAPRFEPGEKLYVYSNRLAEADDDVVIRSRAGGGLVF
jgi:hypothetical protein